jgi:hypothetical protein
MLKIKLEKLNIIKLSDADYVQTSTFNRKYYIFENIIQKYFFLKFEQQ